MSIIQSKFGVLPDGREVDAFTLANSEGMSATVIAWGGRIVSIKTPDRAGNVAEINMGCPTLDPYLVRNNYAGALVGRVANRIAQGRFTLNGKEYSLWTLNNASLHGGEYGFSAKLWSAKIEEERVRLDYHSPDGEENYPGNLDATVWYSLDNNDLSIEYRAVTDKTTIVNMTNHAFFNLNAFSRDVLAHEVELNADRYTPVDQYLVPTGDIAEVADTPYDFSQSKAIGRDIGQTPAGYDHNYVFTTQAKPGEIRWQAKVCDPESGRTMAMATDQPCTQFYTGNFLDGSTTGWNNVVFRKQYAFCLEAQKHPDAINHPNFTSIVLEPGDVYTQKTVYRFGVK